MVRTVPQLLSQRFGPNHCGYTTKQCADISDVKGGSPWGAATIAGANGSRQHSPEEVAQARFQGKHVATIAAKLRG